MKNSGLVLVFLYCILLCSCSRKVSPPPLAKENETITDGYTTSSARNKTGASNSVEHQKTIMTLDDHLRGLAGVNVSGSGSGASVMVRGVNSFQSGSTEPLFIVNGTPMTNYSSAFSAVDPINIKRVTVLADAGSTAIYGVRGANGVIIVTLKNTQ
jgi:TonB-dependent SusC/RagA subfamily outer membrane receptor